MLDLFEKYISGNKICTADNKVLLGVSGGVDSVVMADLFIRGKYIIGVAHCNFQLRGKEADDDQEFVEEWARDRGIDCYVKRFDTINYATQNNLSIQMAARELRYDWFSEIKNKHDYIYVATGHNMDDAIETFFINLIRGTGIRGLTGIKPKSRDIIRPLLFATRKDIIHYAKDRNLKYREDSSNKETKYLRNKIRHNIIPGFIKINPEFNITMTETFERLKETEELFNKTIDKIRAETLVKESQGRILINMEKLKEIKPLDIILYEIIRDFGFNFQITKNIIAGLPDIPGKKYYSKTHRIIKDRKHLIITSIKKYGDTITNIDSGVAEVLHPVHLTFTNFQGSTEYPIPKDRKYAALDSNKVNYPLKLRKWKQGDRFMPLGMKNSRKLSDFFIDNKLSIPDKEDIWLLLSGDQIIWIVNFRIDDRVKVDSATKNILLIEYKENVH